MPQLALRLQMELEDRLRYSPFVRRLMSEWKHRSGGRVDREDPQSVARSIVRLSQAARLAPPPMMRKLEQEIQDCIRLLGHRAIDWEEFVHGANRTHIDRATLLKPYLGEQEKGAIFIAYEYEWVRLLQTSDLEKFARRYSLVISPSWSPPHHIAVCLFPHYYPAGNKIFTFISNEKDLEILPRIDVRYVPMPLYASSLVHPEVHKTRPFFERDIDILMVANFAKYKRHFEFFRALQSIPRDKKVLLIGQSDGSRTPAALMTEAKAYGVEDRFQLIENAGEQELLDAYSRAKVSLILSRQEGSCVAIVESMFADTPVGILEDAEVGSRVFINPATGKFLRRTHLSEDIAALLSEAHKFTPRKWVLENEITCFGSTALLNRVLKEHMLAEGQQWTQDIYPFHWRPHPTLVNREDRAAIQADYDEIERQFGLLIGLD